MWSCPCPSAVPQNSQQHLELSNWLSGPFPERALGYLTSYPGSTMTFDCCLLHQQDTSESSPLHGHLSTRPTPLGAQMLGPTTQMLKECPPAWGTDIPLSICMISAGNPQHLREFFDQPDRNDAMIQNDKDPFTLTTPEAPLITT